MVSLYINMISSSSKKIPVFIYNNITGRDKMIFINETDLYKTHVYIPFTKTSGSVYLYRMQIPTILSPFSAFVVSYTTGACDAVMFPINEKNIANIKHLSLTKKLVEKYMRETRISRRNIPTKSASKTSRLAIPSF